MKNNKTLCVMFLLIALICSLSVLMHFLLHRQVLLQHRHSSTLSVLSRDDNIECKMKRPRITYLKFPTCSSFGDCGVNVCKQRVLKWTMMTFVKSAAVNLARRQLIRKTWGTVNYISGARFNVIFVIGREDPDLEKPIDEEHHKYGDVLQVNVSDGYSDVALKTLAGMQWAHENLPDRYLYSTVDDDVMVNMGRVYDAVENYRKIVEQKLWAEFPILCMHVYASGEPIREATHKNFISKEDYIWPYWPKFCFGAMYTTTVSVAGKLSQLARTSPILKNDDVWITGILRHQLGMPDEMLIGVRPLLTTAIHHPDLRVEKYNTSEWTSMLSYTLNGRFVCLTGAAHSSRTGTE